MQDVFKYLRRADSYIREAKEESQGHKQAIQAGGVTSSYGRYYDKDGKYIGKVVGDKWQPAKPEEMMSRMSGSEAGQADDEPQPKTLDQFRQSANQSQMNRNVPGGPTSDALASGDKAEVEKQLSRGRENVQSPNRKAQISRQADQMIAQDQAEREAAAAAAVETQAVEPKPEKEAAKPPAPEPITLDQAVEKQDTPAEKKTLKDITSRAPKPEKPKKKTSLADRMSAAFDRMIPMESKDDSNIEIDHKDPDSIFVPQPVPQGEMNSVAVSKSTPSPIPPQPGESIGEYNKRAADGYGKAIDQQPLNVPKGMRTADYVFGNSKQTDLIGESAYMEAALKIFDGSYDTDVLQMVGEKNLSKEDQQKVDDLLSDIREAIPSKGLGKGWEESAARMVKLTTQHMDPNRKYKFGKTNSGPKGMKLTTVPEDMQDFSYDLANQLLVDKIGKEGMKELLGNNTSGIMDHYDPTDVVFFAEDAIEPFLARVEALGEEWETGDEKTRNQDLLNGIRKLKQEFMADRSLLPISLKKPKKGSDPHFIPRNVSGEYDSESMNSVDFDLMTEGKDGMSWGFDGSRMGDLTDNFSMNFNMKDEVYSGNKFSMPVINHPGTGPHANNPFSRVANIKSEPSLKGGAEAKLGMLDTNWIGNEKVNEILGYNFEEKYGNRDDNLGIGEKNKADRFSDEDREVLKNLVNEVASHEGSAKVDMKFPKGMDAGQFVDALIDSDNLIHDELEGKTIRSGSRGQDAMDINLDDDAKKRVKEKLGSIPDANFRSKVRTKFRQLRYAKLLQELEKAGKLGDFGKEYIYKNTMKIGDEYSPFILLG